LAMQISERPELPPVNEVRRRIAWIPYRPVRMACMALYLFAARVSEIVARAPKGERCYGIKGTDVYLDKYVMGDRSVDAIIFRVKTAKREPKGMIRDIALPPDYEPWAKELYEYFQQFGDKYVFPMTRQELWELAKPYFADLSYRVYRYPYVDRATKQLVWRPSHDRSFTLHAFRHLRAVELVEYYGFDALNLTAYCGWTIRSGQAGFGMSVSPVMARYLHLSWQGYFPKLLKRRP
jgi:hypothetical protein